VTVNGFSLVTSADSSIVGSISHRDPVGDALSEIGRNELGSTSDEIAAFTGDWSDSRCVLKPGPIESMAMMICVARGGGGAVVCSVSVLCGAGGGQTVHDATSSAVDSNDVATAEKRRKVVGTPFRVSGD
jgi:hypothetical protein